MFPGATSRLKVADPGSTAVAAVCAFASATALAAGTRVAIATVAIPLVALLLAAPAVAAAAGIALLPFAADLLPGSVVKVSASDVLIAVACAGFVLGRRVPTAWFRPMRSIVGLYAAALTLATVAHLDAGAVINAAQRLQIVLIALVVGAAVFDDSTITRRLLTAYVASASVLGVAWSLDVIPAGLGFQKNPVGQYIASALLIIAWEPRVRHRLVFSVPLAIGLLRTESRGAVLGLLIGIAVLAVSRTGESRLRSIGVLVPLTAVFVLAFYSLPDDVQQRTTTLSAAAGSSTSGAYTIQIRSQYRADAFRVIGTHPLLGVGIGNYLAGDPKKGTLTDDPHDVLLLEAAEGGAPLALALVLLLVGTWAALWRIRRQTPLAALALAIHAATVAHGLVDVYWVRGTPVLSWLLTGAALAHARRST